MLCRREALLPKFPVERLLLWYAGDAFPWLSWIVCSSSDLACNGVAVSACVHLSEDYKLMA